MDKDRNLNILHDISILYELSLAMGSSFDLKENIHSFVRVLMARKNIDIVNVWLKASFLESDSETSAFRMVYSNPRYRITKELLPGNHPIPRMIADKKAVSVSYLSPEFEQLITERDIHNGVYTVYPLEDIGFIKLYQFTKRYQWEESELSKYEKVIRQFAQSIIGSVNHHRILHETERRAEAEKAARQREKDFANLVNTINDIFWVYHPEKEKFLYVSPAMEKMVGIPTSELIENPMTLVPFLEAHDEKQKMALWSKVLRGGYEQVEFAMKTADDKTRWLRSASQEIVSEDKKDVRIAGAFTDITSLKQAQHQNEYRLQFEQILLEISTSFINIPADNTDQGIQEALQRIGSFASSDRSYVFQFHDNGNLMSNTHEWCSGEVSPEKDNLQRLPSGTFPWWMEKLSRFETIYLPSLKHLPEHAEAEREILEAQSIKSLIVLPLAMRGNLRGFIGFDFVRKSAAFTDDIIKMLRFVGQMVMNALANKEKNEWLQRQEDRYQSIVESATDIIYRIDREGRFVFMNEKTLEITGFSRQELMGMDFEQVIHPGYVANISRFYRDQFRKRIENTYIEFPIVNRFGEQIWIGQNASLDIERGERAYITVVARDITDIVTANASLKEAYNKAEQANLSKTQFVVNTSHEIRTPVHAISGLIRMMRETELSSQQQHLLQKLENTSNSLNMLVDNVIDFKKIESETIELSNDAFDLKEMLTTLTEMLRFLAEENNVSLDFSMDDQMESRRISDVGKLQRILINLTENAIKFNEGGQAIIYAYEPPAGEKDEVIIEIKDTGIGIDPEIIRRIDSEFNQSDNTMTRKYDGSGLGLYISVELVKLMGGNVNIESQPRQGTRITIHLIMKKQENTSQQKKARPKAEPSRKHFPHLRMLIAEDNKINQLVASRALKSLQIDHDIAANGQEAVELAEKHSYDAILMDLMMPEMDGFEATRVIREELNQKMPIIACTAKKVKGTPEECYEAGMNAYITKPFNESDIRNQLNLLQL